ncbi:hypothetical protein GE21DRAFT_4529 [Neurospora crassa]|uniref:MFS transporter n=1 Tax=Neurospora crassa (strain ATCC 24698 / 74-OR23-1A / CBS 708.71 / DSM 1257 / FGSC 987) TaxID=367110 RepID=Q7RZY5_NEUCR|nr:MFS transporter [Neurospora crassa OR74A]EAA28461.3 MFS transporter [Neurospora crassa OR74A]KHE89687.1 hypothetical protein GE21DRAFT_4529 [Neurospora crassa]|eukprot:XP_957697.3 MFS transporter [Neurospora crassa OR74A]
MAPTDGRPGQPFDFGAFLLRHLPFSSSTTPLQALTYLLGICLFSISFLVFLNSSVSFVITDLIGVKHGVGDIVGTLGFVDEIVALIACPFWGLVSDRVGVRHVAVTGYAIIGLSLLVFVQATNVYPQLLLARILFAVGATAAATMVTAILPSLSDETQAQTDVVENPPLNPRHSITPSVASEVTITPDRFRDHSTSEAGFRFDGTQGKPEGRGKPSALAGYVGLFTGCGALLALSLFLPLPARFGHIKGVTVGQAVQYSYYVVGLVSFLVAIFVFFGLRGIKGEEGKGFRTLFGLKRRTDDHSAPYSSKQVYPYLHLLRDSIRLGLTDSDIALGYLGGFVARASTVAISLFMPLFINAFFIRNGFCQGSPNDPSPELKKECRQAYILSSILTGVAQLMGLLCAPLFGYLSSRKFTKQNRLNYPIIVATTFGIAGYIAFPQLKSPEYKDKDGRGGSPVVFFLAALIGISQIGAIVCSLGSLGRGVLKVDVVNVITHPHRVDRDSEVATVTEPADSRNETAPLLENPGALPEDTVSRVRLKGSVAGVYSWCGGAAILLLTKAGGYGFDEWSTGTPFYMMAGFNVVWLVVSLGIDAGRFGFKRKRGGVVIYGHQVPSGF